MKRKLITVIASFFLSFCFLINTANAYTTNINGNINNGWNGYSYYYFYSANVSYDLVTRKITNAAPMSFSGATCYTFPMGTIYDITNAEVRPNQGNVIISSTGTSVTYPVSAEIYILILGGTAPMYVGSQTDYINFNTMGGAVKSLSNDGLYITVEKGEFEYSEEYIEYMAERGVYLE